MYFTVKLQIAHDGKNGIKYKPDYFLVEAAAVSEAETKADAHMAETMPGNEYEIEAVSLTKYSTVIDGK